MGVNAFGRSLVRLPIRIQNTTSDQKIDARGTTGNTIGTGGAINYKENRKIIWRKSECEKPFGGNQRSSWLQVLRETKLFLVRILGAVLRANACAGAMQIAAGSKIWTSPVGPVDIAETQEINVFAGTIQVVAESERETSTVRPASVAEV